MKRGKSPPPAGPTAEVSALIETLHDTGRRLEDLTAGEVDAVTNRGGETMLLRRAQEQLRHHEAAKQAAILNALPAHIALLDSQGLIISVNEAWRRFGRASAVQGPGYELGVNYLEICDNAAGDDAAEAHQVAAGIRSVLGGGVNSFSIEYPCHLPTAQCWFLLTVTPLVDDHPNSVVVMHLNITARKNAEKSLKDLGQKYRTMFEASNDALMLLEETGFVDGNEAAIRLFRCHARDDLIGKNPAQLSRPVQPGGRDSMSLANEHIAKVFKDGGYRFDWMFRRIDGTDFLADVLLTRMELDSRLVVLGTVRDITERKAAENRITYLNRVYAMLSGINTLIVRVRDREELFKEACRIAIKQGGFSMAWVVIVDHSAMKMTLVAAEGMDEELLAAIKDLLSSSEGSLLGATLTARTVREKKAVVVHDVQSAPGILFSKEHAEAGIRSIAILPLMVADQTVGALGLYSGESEFFHEEEMKLLTELAGDIAFAIDHLDQQQQLDYLAYHDVLTGLANRTLFLDRVTQYLHSAVSGGYQLAVFLIDLERFKNINDSLGQPAGDALLRQVAQWLTQIAGRQSVGARGGGPLRLGAAGNKARG